jgi:ribonuclease-3
VYKVVRISGPDHRPQYEVKVFLENHAYGKGLGTSKKEAEQQAAAQALEKIQKQQPAPNQAG